jgi:lysophospholipase L1-like esterase
MTTPSVCCIGDSISLGYGPFLERSLLGTASYHRKEGMAQAQVNLDNPAGANGGDSQRLLSFLQERAEAFSTPAYDLLLLNCGLHDIKVVHGNRAVDEQSYHSNLESMIRLAPQLSRSLMWIRTTPVDDSLHAARGCSFDRYDKDVDAYNAIADSVMSAAGISIIDLHGFIRSLPEAGFRDGVHFHQETVEKQGVWLAGWVLAHLRQQG